MFPRPRDPSHVALPAFLLAVLFLVPLLRIEPPDAAAPGEVMNESVYELRDASHLERGCYGGCTCAITSSPLRGTFRLVLESVDPLYRNYRVEDFDAVVNEHGHALRLRGGGTYRTGGEVAQMHQMALELAGTGGPQRFDSGLVPGGSNFPSIMIALAANGFACFDSVLDVRAEPARSDVEDREITGASRPGIIAGRGASPPSS